MPTVFLRSRKTELELPVSFTAYPRHRKTEFEIPVSFRFPSTLKMNSSFSVSFLVFPRFWTTPTTLKACTLVPTVFLRSGKTELELQFRFPFTHVIEKWNSRFRFRFPFSYYCWKWNLSFCFRVWFSHDFGQQNSNSHFRFSTLVFVRYWKTNFDLRFSFFAFAFLSLPYFT